MHPLIAIELARTEITQRITDAEQRRRARSYLTRRRITDPLDGSARSRGEAGQRDLNTTLAAVYTAATLVFSALNSPITATAGHMRAGDSGR